MLSGKMSLWQLASVKNESRILLLNFQILVKIGSVTAVSLDIYFGRLGNYWGTIAGFIAGRPQGGGKGDAMHTISNRAGSVNYQLTLFHTGTEIILN